MSCHTVFSPPTRLSLPVRTKREEKNGKGEKSSSGIMSKVAIHAAQILFHSVTSGLRTLGWWAKFGLTRCANWGFTLSG